MYNSNNKIFTMNNTVYYLHQSLKSFYPIPADRKEEALQTFAMGLDFGLSLVSPFQEEDC